MEEERSASGWVGKKVRNNITLPHASATTRYNITGPRTQHSHEHKTPPLQPDLRHAQQPGRALSRPNTLATSDISPTRREDQDVAERGDATEAAEEDPPGREAFGAAVGDDFDVLRQVRDQDPDEDEGGEGDGVGVGVFEVGA